MSKTGEILKNFQINIFFTVITSILNFIINSFFLKKIGVDLLGLSKLFTQFIAYLSLADLGLGTASTYALYKPLAEKNYKKINIIFSTLENFYKKIAIFICSIGVTVSPLLSYLIPSENYGAKIYFYWSLYILNTAVTYLYAKYNILFLANQEYRYSRIILGGTTILSQISQLIIIIFIKSFVFYIMAMIFTGIIVLICFRKHYLQNYSYIEKTKERDLDIKRDMKKLFFQKIGSVIVFNTDYIILSIFESLALIGIYSSYLVIYNAMIVFTSMILNVITPQIGQYIAERSKEDIYNLWKEFHAAFIFLSTILVFTTYHLIQNFIILWLGKKYLLSNITVVLIMINLFINITRTITETFKNSSGYFNDIHIPFLEGAINLIISLILVKKMGLDGVILGTVVSNISVVIFTKPYLVFRNCFDRKYQDYLKELFKFISISLVGMMASDIFIKNIFVQTYIKSWKEWIISAIETFIVTIVTCIFIFLVTPEFRKNISRFTYLLKLRERKI
jgi:O-antigen/teichoic acid export membrane protein